MTPMMLYILCVLIGGVSGLRTMTGIALVALGAQSGWPHLGWLHLAGTPLRFLSLPVSMYVFVALAIGELIGDKLPIPPRIQPGPLVARAVFGGLCASALGIAAGESWIVPALMGAVAALVAAYAGYWMRRTITSRGVPDLPVALGEDTVAILIGLFTVSRF